MLKSSGSPWWLAAAFALLVEPALVAQGVEVKRDAMVLYGSASNTSQPATVDMKKVEKETSEYKTIRSEGVRKGTARYELLLAQMHKRIKSAAKSAAEAKKVDCVIRDGDIKDSNGLTTTDLTEEVIAQLESSADGA